MAEIRELVLTFLDRLSDHALPKNRKWETLDACIGKETFSSIPCIFFQNQRIVPCKVMPEFLDSGFQVPDSGFFVCGTWIPDSFRWIPDSKAQNSWLYKNYLTCGGKEFGCDRLSCVVCLRTHYLACPLPLVFVVGSRTIDNVPTCPSSKNSSESPGLLFNEAKFNQTTVFTPLRVPFIWLVSLKIPIFWLFVYKFVL